MLRLEDRDSFTEGGRRTKGTRLSVGGYEEKESDGVIACVIVNRVKRGRSPLAGTSA